METDVANAFGAGNHMVVWSDARLHTPRIFASRVTPAGTVLDPSGIQIGPSLDTTKQYSPSLIFTGSRFIAVWSYGGLHKAITGRFIDTNGQPADTFRICALSQDPSACRIAFDGNNFLVVWSEFTTPITVNGQLVSGNGIPIGSRFLIGNTYKGLFGVCFDATNYCVTWSDTVIKGRKYNTSGQPVGPVFKVSNSTNSQSNSYVIAGVNNRYLNVWTENFPTSYNDIYGNLDIQVSAITESQPKRISKISLKSTIVRNIIELSGAEGKEALIFDASGRKSGSTRNGRFDCRELETGVYFVKLSTGEQFKLIKIK